MRTISRRGLGSGRRPCVTCSRRMLQLPLLAAVAELLKKNPSHKIQVAGHTDSTGDAKKNQELSERRAAAVKKVLVEKYGADTARITVKGSGANQPVADNQTEDGRALNRRVEIVVSR